MFIIYGKRKARIKRYTDNQQACQSCKTFDLDVTVYREYYHLYYIPVFPVGSKTVEIRCKHCGEPLRSETAKEQYYKTSRTPFYLFSLPILVAGLVLFLVTANISTQKEKAAFVANPKVGDVYLIRKDEYNKTTYYYLRLVSIKGDTVTAYHSNLEYSRYITGLNEDDFFVKEDELYFLRSGLKQMLGKGEINAVERGYGDNEGFNRIR